ncbi:MAG: IclR family transcriptional regulator [Rhizobiaceae bacterium]|nr:MAG: IclR family transcriptional regulator [Rhizobiaceae bacterium]
MSTEITRGVARDAAAAGDRLFVQSLAKAIALLEAFSGSPAPKSLSQLAERAGCDRSTAQRMAHTLIALGYLERTATGLVPGIRLVERACDYLRSNPFIERATPIIIDLRRSTTERVDFSVFDDLGMVFSIRQPSKRETFVATVIGRRVPTFCSSGGRAVLAALPDARVDDIIRRSDRRQYTPGTKTTPAEIWKEVRKIRQTGYAIAVEELLPGEVSLGTAVTEQDLPVAAIHVAGSLSEWSVADFAAKIGPLAMEAARALSR